MGVVIGGVLIDIDHLIEYYKYSRKKFSYKNFLEFYDLLHYEKAYVFFHSYELLLFAGIAISIYSRSYLLYGLVLGAVIHMIMDIVGNPVYLKGYFFIYRIFTGFKRENFIDVKKHFEQREKRKSRKKNRKKILSLIISLSLLSLLISSCGAVKKKEEIYYPFYKEKGIASWYGEDFHGKPTSSGEIYDMYRLTAAHKTLPLQTMVHVTNIENGKSVDVRINDRGPFVKGRILDLSYGAAKVLDMVEAGVSMVGIEVISDERDFEERIKEGNFTVQAGAFLIRENAEKLANKLNREYGNAYITLYETNSNRFNRVRVGNFPTLDEAEKFAERLEKKGFTAFVARKDN